MDTRSFWVSLLAVMAIIATGRVLVGDSEAGMLTTLLAGFGIGAWLRLRMEDGEARRKQSEAERPPSR